MTPHNIYHFSFPIYSQQTLDVAAVCGDAGQFLPIDIFTGIGQLHKFSNFSYEKNTFRMKKNSTSSLLMFSHCFTLTFFLAKITKKKYRARWKEQEDLEILGDNQFVAANRGKLPFSANTVRLTTQNENKIVEEVFMFSSQALFANLPHSLISKALRYLKMKIHFLRKIKECFLFNS